MTSPDAATMQERLANFPHFRADNLKAVRAWASKRLRVSRRTAAGEVGIDYRVNLVRWKYVTLVWIGFDVPMHVKIPSYRAGYLVQVPDDGEQYFTLGKERIAATPDRAVIVSPHHPGPLEHSSGPGGRLVLQLDSALIRASLRESVGIEPDEALPDLPLAMDLTTGHGRLFKALVTGIVEELERSGPAFLSQEKVLEHLTRSLGALLVAPAVDMLDRRASPIDNVLSYVLRHLDQPMTIDELAEAGGMNKRSLQRAFQARFEMSPMEFVRRRRLEEAHAMLASGAAGLTVTAVALRAGFGHMGRFARDYHSQYGEKPSETLGRAREGRPRG